MHGLDPARGNDSLKLFFIAKGLASATRPYGKPAFSARERAHRAHDCLVCFHLASLMMSVSFAGGRAWVFMESGSSCVLFAVNPKGGRNADLVYGLAQR